MDLRESTSQPRSRKRWSDHTTLGTPDVRVCGILKRTPGTCRASIIGGTYNNNEFINKEGV